MNSTSSTERATARDTDGSESVGEEFGDGSAASGIFDVVSDERAESVDLSLIFEILKNRRRRRVLRYLLQGDGQSTLSTLAEHLASIENDKPEQLLSSQERKRVYIGLYQCHLPRMDMAGVIEFDRHRGTVELADWATVLTPYVTQQSGHARSQLPAPIRSTVVIAVSSVVAIGFLAPVLPSWLGSAMLLGMISLITVTSLKSVTDHRSPGPQPPIEAVLGLGR